MCLADKSATMVTLFLQPVRHRMTVHVESPLDSERDKQASDL